MSGQVGTLGTLKIRLSPWVPRNERYRRQYVPLNPESESVSSRDTGLVVDTKFRPWVVRSWSRGEGFDVWRREDGGYRQSDGIVPVVTGDGLRLAYNTASTSITGGGGTLSGMLILGIAQGKLWALFDNDAYAWDPTNNDWDASIGTGAANNDQATSIADGQDTWIYSGHEGFRIWRWKSGSQEEHCDNTTGFTWPPLLRAFGTRIFALDGDQLYEVDKVTPDTITQVATVDGDSDNWLASGPTWMRMASSDVGLVWIQRLDNGQTLIHEYNVAEDTQKVIGKVPVDWVWPYSIYHAFGFVFVAFRTATSSGVAGEAFVYFQRGQQRGIIGPIRRVNAAAAPNSMVIAGTLGSDLIIVYDDIFSYDVDEGGIVRMADATFGVHLEQHAIVFGRDVFMCQANVMRMRADTYIDTGFIHLGWHDFDYPGLRKQFLDVTIITDPLPAGTAIFASVAVDGSTTYTGLVGNHSVDGATKFTFPVANPTSAPITGNRFEVLLSFTTSINTNTPIVREVAARATGADHVLEVVMQLDVGDIGEQTSSTLIDGLNAMAVASAPVNFDDVFQQRQDAEAVDVYTVTVEEVVTPTLESPVDDDDHPVALVRLRAMSLV